MLLCKERWSKVGYKKYMKLTFIQCQWQCGIVTPEGLVVVIMARKHSDADPRASFREVAQGHKYH